MGRKEQRSGRLRLLLAGLFVVLAAHAASGLERANADLSPDTSFGDEGTRSLSSDVGITGMSYDKDGGVVFTAWVYPANYMPFYVGRLDSHGNLDTDFGDEGFATPFGLPSSTNWAKAIDVDSNGRAVAVGEQRGSASTYPLITRLDPDGSRDRSFKPQGKYSVEGLGLEDVITLPNRRIVTVGTAAFRGSSGTSVGVVRKYKANGKLDGSFGLRGEVKFKGLPNEEAVSLTRVTQDGSGFLVAGVRRNGIFVAKLTSRGKLDRNFSRNGIEVVRGVGPKLCPDRVQCHVYGLEVAGNGIKVAYETPVKPGSRRNLTTVVSLKHDGSPDPWFSKRGRVHIPAGGRDMTRLRDDSLVLLVQPRNRPRLTRMGVDGKVDRDFRQSAAARFPVGDLSDAGALAANLDGFTAATWGEPSTVRRIESPYRLRR